MNLRDAEDKAMVKPSKINVDELMGMEKRVQGSKKYFRDGEGKQMRKVTMKNFDSKLKIGTQVYTKYSDWEKKGGYHSDQWDRFPLQQDLYTKCLDDSGTQFYSLTNQEQYDASELPLYPLDVEKDILDDFTCVLIGRRRSGKSFLSRWIMYHLRYRFPFGIVITGTRLNNYWAQYVPEEFIHDIEDISSVMNAIFARQTLIKAHPELGIDPRMFIILDDVMGNKYVTRFSTELSNIFTNGRHYQIFTLITLQDAKGIPPDLRENTDMCMIFRVYEGGRKKVVCEEWLSYIEEMKRISATTETNKTKGMTPTMGISKQKNHTTLSFFTKNTGLLDVSTCEAFQETKDTTDADTAKGVPQCIVVLQGRTTDNLQAVMKKAVAEDPGPFILGDERYYKAATTGNYLPIMGTFKAFRRRGKRRIKSEGFIDGKHTSTTTTSSSEV